LSVLLSVFAGFSNLFGKTIAHFLPGEKTREIKKSAF
jgi:hypothetical protein